MIDKPAPLPMHPCGRFDRNTLQSILNTVYRPQCPRPAHRLDANTTGVIVLTRSKKFAAALQAQFTRCEVEKVYLARVRGHPATDMFSNDQPISVDAGDLGSRTIDAEGQAARTDFRVLKRCTDGTTLMEVRPLTGRTNQIRVHLWQLGWPVVGDSTYLPDQRLGDTQTHSVDAPPLCLHAWRIQFQHPLSMHRVAFEAPTPAWACNSFPGSAWGRAVEALPR